MSQWAGTPKHLNSKDNHLRKDQPKNSQCIIHSQSKFAMGRGSKYLILLLAASCWWSFQVFIGGLLRGAPLPGKLGKKRDLIRREGVKGYFAIRDLLVLKRNDEDVAAFHEKERKRWREVYDEEYVESPQDFYPGDRVEVIADVSVNKDIKNAEGMQGVVTHFDFDDGYESCQTCQSSYPVTVLLDDP